MVTRVGLSGEEVLEKHMEVGRDLQSGLICQLCLGVIGDTRGAEW